MAFEHDFTVYQAESRLAAIKLLRALPTPPQIALIDLGLPPVPHRPDEGFHLITDLLAHVPEIKIFTLSGQDEQSNARHARTLGAVDFIAKPCSPEKIRGLLYAALDLQKHELKHLSNQENLLGIIGESAPIQALRKQIVMYANMPFPVLIEGESGSGKELIAAALQQLGGQPRASYKVLNCAAISPSLLEATLFGHSKGAFTGATNAQTGFFEDAENGTLFLDEIGELPLELQTKLLRVLENGEYQRVGETATRKSNARIIAATNRNLREAVKAGTFRGDVYHRLNVFSIQPPPLRELGTDKLLLLAHFRVFYAQQLHQLPFVLSATAQQLWESYSFPGNTRELRNIVIRLSAKYPDMTVSSEQLQDEFDPLSSDSSMAYADTSLKEKLLAGQFNLDLSLREQERTCIKQALELATGNISEAAKLLGINRTTLHSRIDTLGISKEIN